MATPTELDKLHKAWSDLRRAINETLPDLKRRAHAAYLRGLGSGSDTSGK